VFPEDTDPRVYLTAWSGDLGLDSGVPQNVYQLDTADLSQLGRKSLAPGQEWRLPDNKGSIAFDGWREFANLQIGHDPGGPISLVAAIAAITGVTTSLLVRRRRIWLRASPPAAGSALIEVAGLARSESTGLQDEVQQILDAATEEDIP
jgi:cytochrome c biogenesis protein